MVSGRKDRIGQRMAMYRNIHQLLEGEVDNAGPSLTHRNIHQLLEGEADNAGSSLTRRLSYNGKMHRIRSTPCGE
jgi:hypothetical protein